MAIDETPGLYALQVDRGYPAGLSQADDERLALHVKIKNNATEAVPFSPKGLSGGLKVSVLTITDVPAAITPAALTNRNSISVRIWGANTVYFGTNSSVTSASGYPKLTKEEMAIDMQDGGTMNLWAVCAAGQTSEIRILEIS